MSIGLQFGWSPCGPCIKGRRMPVRPVLIPSSSSAASHSDGSYGEAQKNDAVVSGTTARGRRLLKIREEKRKREYDRLHNYPSWAKLYSCVCSYAPTNCFEKLDYLLLFLFCGSRVLEDACKSDEELRAVLGDSIGNAELMKKKVLLFYSFTFLLICFSLIQVE